VALSFILNPHEPSKLTLIVEKFYLIKNIPFQYLIFHYLSLNFLKDCELFRETTSLMLVFIIANLHLL
jgi:hypothetical protein